MTKFRHLSAMLFNQPLLTTPEYAETICAVLGDRLDISNEGMFAQGQPKEQKPYQIIGSTAIVPIAGSMTHKAMGLNALSGMTSYEQIERDIIKAMDDN